VLHAIANENRVFKCEFSGLSYQSKRNAFVCAAMFHGESVALVECAVSRCVNASVRWADPLNPSSVLVAPIQRSTYTCVFVDLLH
jgi:hypothetical protein